MTETRPEQALDDIVQKTDKLVVVDFATTWCGPQGHGAQMNQISEEYTDAEFYKVVGDASADSLKLMKRERPHGAELPLLGALARRGHQRREHLCRHRRAGLLGDAVGLDARGANATTGRSRHGRSTAENALRYSTTGAATAAATGATAAPSAASSISSPP